MRVVPDPVNGSRMVPFGGVMSRMSQRMSAIGFTVGWKFWRGVVVNLSLTDPLPMSLPFFWLPYLLYFFGGASSPALRSVLDGLAQ